MREVEREVTRNTINIDEEEHEDVREKVQGILIKNRVKINPENWESSSQIKRDQSLLS